MLAALRPINWKAQTRAVAVQMRLPVQGEGNAPVSRAKFVRAALGSGSAAPGDPCGPVRERALVADGWRN